MECLLTNAQVELVHPQEEAEPRQQFGLIGQEDICPDDAENSLSLSLEYSSVLFSADVEPSTALDKTCPIPRRG